MENFLALPHLQLIGGPPPPSARMPVFALEGESIAVTGRTKVPRHQLEADILGTGASFQTIVNAQTTLLVVPRLPCDLNTAKVIDARLNNVRIISEDELRDWILASDPPLKMRPAKKTPQEIETMKKCNMSQSHARGTLLDINMFGTFSNGRVKSGCKACLTRMKAEPGVVAAVAERIAATDANYLAHVEARGGTPEERLEPVQVDATAADIEIEIRSIIPRGERDVLFNVFTSQKRRCIESSTKRSRDGSFKCTINGNEGWAGPCVNRGNGSAPSQLLSFADGSAATASQLRALGWRVHKLSYETERPPNMNDVEKKVHELLRSEPGSLWKVCGAGGVKLGAHKTPVFAIGIVYGPRTASDGTAVLRKGGPDVVAV